MVSLFPFVRRRDVKEFLCQFPTFLGELPSPAWSFPGAGSVPVDSVGVSPAFEFDHAAPQALWCVAASQHRCRRRQAFLRDRLLD